MSKGEMASIKAKMKKSSSYIWIETADGSIQLVEEEVAMCCPMIRQEVLKNKGSSKNNAIRLPEKVTPKMLSLIFDYCRFHLEPGHSVMEHKTYDENLIRMDPTKLGELTSAADSLKLKELVELTTRAFANMIERIFTREEMREICHWPYDLTEEEKLKPVENPTNDPRIRLLNRRNAKKLKELKGKEKLKSVAVEEEEEEERSVDDLLSFINGEDDDPKVVKKKTSKSKKKKKNNKQKNGSTSTGGTCEEASQKDSHDNIRSKSTSAEIVDNTESSLGDEIVDKVESSLGDEIVDKSESSVGDEIVDDGVDDGNIDDGIDDGDIDDDIDPALKEKVDREVEEFAKRLNVDKIYR